MKYLHTVCMCCFLILLEKMLLWKQITFPFYHYCNTQTHISGLSRDTFDEILACTIEWVLTNLKVSGFLLLCSGLFSVDPFEPKESNTPDMPSGNRTSMETMACFSLTSQLRAPNLRYAKFTAVIVPPCLLPSPTLFTACVLEYLHAGVSNRGVKLTIIKDGRSQEVNACR